MPGIRKRDTHPATDKAEEIPAAEKPDADSADRAAKASADAAATVDHIDDLLDDPGLLDDCNESLNASLGFQPGETVDPVEMEKRAKEMVGQFTQKGGQ